MSPYLNFRLMMRRRLSHEQFEARLCLSAVAFLENDMVTNNSVQSVYAADLDNDGDLDLVSTAWGSGPLAWYENTDGQGNFGQGQVITEEAQGAVVAADLDGDGDMDVLSGFLPSNRMAWFENTDGAGSFGEPNLIDVFFPNEPGRGPDRTGYVYVADLDGDGDLDILRHSRQFGEAQWFENIDGEGWFSERIIYGGQSTSEPTYDQVSPVDIDGDGDTDILAGTYNGIRWHENVDGRGDLHRYHTINRTHSGNSRAVDVDGDGDVDVISNSWSWNWERGWIGWHENTDGQGHFGEERVITNQPATNIYPADLDGDGDMDIVLRRDNTIAWHENTDGQGHFGEEQVITTKARGSWYPVLWPADLDSDGDVDVISVTDIEGNTWLTWHENRLVGDANDDGVFNSSDLVTVFQAGKYEDGIADNATFDEGDWNQDGDFDSSDLVMAFQTGLYEVEPQVDPGKIAAAVDWLFFDDNQRDARQRAYVA